MGEPLQDIAKLLNNLPDSDLPSVYVDTIPQPGRLPYVLLSRLDSNIDRYFGPVGSAFQSLDFQVEIWEVGPGKGGAESAWEHYEEIKQALELQDVDGYDGIVFRLAPPRTNILEGNYFEIVSPWRFFFDESALNGE